MELQNAAERQKLLMAKYYATIDRFEQLKEAKRQDLRDRMYEKEQHALERRKQMSLLEKRRVILMHRKFALENGLVRQRMRLIRMRKRRMTNDEIQCNWDKHTEFRLQCKMRDEQLLALEHELRTYKVMLRNQSVQKSFERDLHNILLTRAKLVLDRYPGRTKEDLVQMMISEIRRLLKHQLDEEVEMARSSSQYVGNSEMRSQRSNTNATVSAAKVSSIKSMQVESQTTIRSDVLWKKSGSAQSSRPKTIPYEPHHLTSVGLIDNVKGYGKLTEADIRKAVESSYDTMVGLNGNISAQQVLEEANAILLRICKGYANDIPRDDAVVECVRNRVKNILEAIQQSYVDRVLNAHSEYFESIPTNIDDETEALEKPTRDLNLQFGETTAIGTSTYSNKLKSVKPIKSRKPTPTTSVRKVARNILEEEPVEPSDDPRIHDEDMQQRSIAHLYDFQKVMILDNLERFKQKLDEKLEASLRKTINLNKCVFEETILPDQELTKDQEDFLTSQVTDTVLTLPEKDPEFGYRVLVTTDTLTPPILSKIQKALEEVHDRNQQSSQKDDDVSTDDSTRLCGCFGRKSKNQKSKIATDN